MKTIDMTSFQIGGGGAYLSHPSALNIFRIVTTHTGLH